MVFRSIAPGLNGSSRIEHRADKDITESVSAFQAMNKQHVFPGVPRCFHVGRPGHSKMLLPTLVIFYRPRQRRRPR